MVFENDKENRIIYRTMIKNDIEQVIEVFAKSFYQNEPIASPLATNWSYEDQINFATVFVPAMVKNNNSVVALNTNTDEIIGGLLNKDFADHEPEGVQRFILYSDGDTKIAMTAIKSLEVFLLNYFAIKSFDSIPTGKFFQLWLAGVLPKYRDKKIATKLLKYSLMYAKNQSYKYAFAQCTSLASTRLANKFPANIIHTLDYNTWKYDSFVPFNNLARQGEKELSLVLFNLLELNFNH